MCHAGSNLIILGCRHRCANISPIYSNNYAYKTTSVAHALKNIGLVLARPFGEACVNNGAGRPGTIVSL